MTDFFSRKQDITWTSPSEQVFIIKTNESGFKRKHVGEVKENPKVKNSTKKKIVESSDTFTDLGVSGRDISLDCFFVGDSHDEDANIFMNALCEIGKSRLRLAYGEEFTVNVLDFSVKNDLVKNINLTTVSVNFHETSKTTYPKSSSSGKKQVQNEAAQTNETAAQNLSDAVEDISTDPSRLSSFATSYSNMMNNVAEALSTANDVSLNSIMTDIIGQNVVSNAFTMTSQLQIVMSKAALLAFKVKDLGSEFSISSPLGSVMGYWQALISSLMSGFSSSSSLRKSDIDKLLINDTAAISALAGLSENIVNAEFETRKEAVEAANSLIDLEEKWTEFIEDQCSKIAELNDVFIRDTGINELVGAAAGEMLKKSYELKVEKTIVLSEDKAIIEIAYENYPDDFARDPDKTIDYLIRSNNFDDNNFFLVTKGSEVKIYV